LVARIEIVCSVRPVLIRRLVLCAAAILPSLEDETVVQKDLVEVHEFVVCLVGDPESDLPAAAPLGVYVNLTRASYRKTADLLADPPCGGIHGFLVGQESRGFR
jgi:hypothetical protein